MTKNELAMIAELTSKVEALSAKIEELSKAKPAAKPNVHPAWVNPNKRLGPSINEVVEWRRAWAKNHVGFTAAQVTEAEAAFRAEWHAAHQTAA